MQSKDGKLAQNPCLWELRASGLSMPDPKHWALTCIAILRVWLILQEAAALHEGFFLAATLGGILVARATPDGRFTVLHNLARPPDARTGCLPYPTWQPSIPAPRPASSSSVRSVMFLDLQLCVVHPLRSNVLRLPAGRFQ